VGGRKKEGRKREERTEERKERRKGGIAFHYAQLRRNKLETEGNGTGASNS
jgi:hypothetical protein